jgi:hypothetical protein
MDAGQQSNGENHCFSLPNFFNFSK